jgi:hypothetical protein
MRPLTLLLVLILSASLCGLAQTPVPAPVNPASPVIVGGYATSAPVSPPLINTPQVTLGITSPDPVGAHAATGTNQVGASASTLNQDASNQVFINSIEETAPATPAAGSTGATLIVASPMSTYHATGMTSTRSLGEVAAWYRQHGPHASRVYTNDDIARLNQQTSSLPSSDQGVATTGTLPNGAPSNTVAPATSVPNPQTDNSAGGVLPSTVAAPNSAPETKPSAAPPVDNKRSPFAPPADDKVPPARPPQ